MEKQYRLIVKNLPSDIDNTRIEKLFSQYVTVNNVDLKEKKNLNEINKFAFVSVNTTDKTLHTCFEQLNGKRINGSQISVELAKESFLERLKRERSENEHKKEKSNVVINEHYENFNSSHSANATTKPKHQVFSDVDFSSTYFEDKGVTENQTKDGKEISNRDFDSPKKNCKLQYEETPQCEQHCLSFSLRKSKDRGQVEEKRVETPELLLGGKRPSLPTGYPKKKIKIKDSNGLNEPVNESEKKRLLSLKQKKQNFKKQEKIIRDALMDTSRTNHKIMFDDVIEEQYCNVTAKKSENKKALFDSDDENVESFEWNENDLESKANQRAKLMKLQTNIGNDARFNLDHRFIDENDVADEEQKNEGDSSTTERQWQLDILGNVLGKPMTTPTAKIDATKKKNCMIRYDPTASNHEDYEVKADEKEKEKPARKKRKQNITETSESLPVPTSKEVFYDVSDKLKESLKESQGFSLLKAFGRDNSNENKNSEETRQVDAPSFKFSFEKNPFKYDSSDDEGNHIEKEEKNLPKKTNIKEIPKNDRLFFTHDDSRFQEAEQFFKNQSSCGQDAFKNRRRELKEIVRSKIRNNLRKSVPWNRRKVRKIQKKSKM